jgi:hypothetical protein
MAELKTKPTPQSVEQFINSIPDESKRADCFTILNLMRQATGSEPRMWGDAIIGFGDYHYKYASGREGDWFRVGFSPRKANLTLYLGFDVVQFAGLLEKLGKYKHGKGCLYINRLSDVDLDTLKKLIDRTAERMQSANEIK